MAHAIERKMMIRKPEGFITYDTYVPQKYQYGNGGEINFQQIMQQ